MLALLPEAEEVLRRESITLTASAFSMIVPDKCVDFDELSLHANKIVV